MAPSLALSQLAFRLQLKGPGQHRWWPVDEAYADLEADDEATAHAMLKAACDLQVLDMREEEGEIRFAHQQLQEYFAARHWVQTQDDAAFRQATKGQRSGDANLGDPVEALIERLQPGERLAERKSTGWEETGVMALALARDAGFVERLAEADIVTAGQGVLSSHSGWDDAERAKIRKRLATCLTDPTMDVRTRVDAGLAMDDDLSVLGFERRRSHEGVAYWWPPMVTIPAGTYVVGSDDGDEDAYDHEKPTYEHVVGSGLALARYPVTNAEYALFMAARGYEDERWWPEGQARAWRRAEREDTQGKDLAEYARNLSPAQLENDAQHQGWTDADRARVDRARAAASLQEAAKLFQPASHPALDQAPQFWSDVRFNRPLQPVVGLCVFEADAYVAWFCHHAEIRVTLPTEANWEASARGPARRTWACGDRASVGQINTRSLGLRRTSPVGAFPSGATELGLADLSGNIWEWTASGWSQSYATTGRAEDLRVVRGGSWNFPMRYARAAYRFRYPLDTRYHDLGFRLCIQSPQSDS